MSSDFWAGYLSGALGIIIGNPLDVIKVRLQAGHTRDASAQSQLSRFEKASSLVRGAAAPILGYGALNALLFVAYNRSLMAMDSSITDPTNPDGVPLYKIWIAGAAGGLASWTISSPTEFIKCRAQLDSRPEVSSWTVAKNIYRNRGLRGLYYGGAITSARDSIGYGF
ncbi:Mitochondrial basic amino acids transporter [Penicillium subrubescens]|nr:Mitochondrial basic amino acids transporter [Penicillium subrubescens]